MKPDYHTIFEIAIRAEREAQQLYLDIVAMFSAYQPAVDLWIALARDEHYHARALEHLLAEAPASALQAEISPLLWEQAQALLRLNHDQLRASIASLDDAYQLTHELEHSEVNSMFEFLVHAFLSDPKFEVVTLQNLREHLMRLVQAPDTLGPAEVRQRIMAQRAFPEN